MILPEFLKRFLNFIKFVTFIWSILSKDFFNYSPFFIYAKLIQIHLYISSEMCEFRPESLLLSFFFLTCANPCNASINTQIRFPNRMLHFGFKFWVLALGLFRLQMKSFQRILDLTLSPTYPCIAIVLLCGILFFPWRYLIFGKAESFPCLFLFFFFSFFFFSFVFF